MSLRTMMIPRCISLLTVCEKSSSVGFSPFFLQFIYNLIIYLVMIGLNIIKCKSQPESIVYLHLFVVSSAQRAVLLFPFALSFSLTRVVALLLFY